MLSRNLSLLQVAAMGSLEAYMLNNRTPLMELGMAVGAEVDSSYPMEHCFCQLRVGL
jgi:hypothetical protein